MTEIKVENAAKDLVGLIDGHSVLFTYGAQTRMSELVYYMMYSLVETIGAPVPMVVFAEQSREPCNEFDCKNISDMDNVLAPAYGNLSKYSLGGVTCTDMTELLMRMESKIQARQLLFIEDLAFLRWRHNKVPFIRFLDLLSSRVKDKQGTMICTVGLNMFDTETEKLLYTVFDTVFYVTEDAIQFGPKKSKDDIQYTVEDGKMLLKPAVSTDLKKVKEIFSISMEDRKELDKIVHEHIEEYKRS